MSEICTTTLDDLIAAAKADVTLNYINEHISSKNFPEAGVRGELVLVDLQLSGWFSTHEAIETLDRLGYRPATMYEGVKYATTPFADGGWDRETTLAILGSISSPSRIYDYVGYLAAFGSEHDLRLYDIDFVWSRNDRFLAIAK